MLSSGTFSRRSMSKIFFCFAGSLAITSMAAAQQVTGTMGSPSATSTISGKQLPPPDPKFGGVI